MSIKEIRRHISRDDFLVGFERVEITVTHLRRNLEADVQKLPKAGVVGRVGLIVAERGDVLLAGPPIDGIGRGKLCGIDVDDSGVGRAELFAVTIGLAVDLFGDGQSRSTSFSESDQFFEPGSSSRLEVQARARGLHGFVRWACRWRTCRSRSGR